MTSVERFLIGTMNPYNFRHLIRQHILLQRPNWPVSEEAIESFFDDAVFTPALIKQLKETKFFLNLNYADAFDKLDAVRIQEPFEGQDVGFLNEFFQKGTYWGICSCSTNPPIQLHEDILPVSFEIVNIGQNDFLIGEVGSVQDIHRMFASHFWRISYMFLGASKEALLNEEAVEALIIEAFDEMAFLLLVRPDRK